MGPEGRRRRALALLSCLALLAFGALLLQGFHEHRDIDPNDEAHYLRQGRRLAAGRWSEVSYAWSLPLSVSYALLELLPGAGVRPADLLYPIGVMGSGLVLWWALRALVPSGAALLAAGWWMASDQALGLGNVGASSHTLAFALGALALGLVARGRRPAALAVMVLGVLNRSESALWMLATGLAWLVGSRRSRNGRWRDGWLFAGTGAALLVALQHGWKARSRGWLAFRQHFAWAHGDGQPVDAVIESAFPGATSLAKVVLQHPDTLLGHVAENLQVLPQRSFELATRSFTFAPAVAWAALAALALLIGAGAWARRAPGPRADERWPAGARSFAWSSLAVLPVALLLSPRPALLLPIYLALIAEAARLANWGWHGLVRASSRSKLGTLAILPPVLLLSTLLAPRPFRAARPGGTPWRDGLALVETLAEEPPFVLFGRRTTGLLIHADLSQGRALDVSAPDFFAQHRGLRLEEILRLHDVDFLLATPSFAAEIERYSSLEPELESGRWRLRGRFRGAALYARQGGG